MEAKEKFVASIPEKEKERLKQMDIDSCEEISFGGGKTAKVCRIDADTFVKVSEKKEEIEPIEFKLYNLDSVPARRKDESRY